MQAEQTEQVQLPILSILFPQIVDQRPSISDENLQSKLLPHQLRIVQNGLSAIADLVSLEPRYSARREMLIQEIQEATTFLHEAARLCLDEMSPIAIDDSDIESQEEEEFQEEFQEESQQCDEVHSAGSPMVRRSSVTGSSFKEPWKPKASKNKGIREESLQDCNLPNGHHSHSERFRHKNRAAKSANEASRRQDAKAKRVLMETP